MKLPSLSTVAEQALRTARRFPFAIASAIVCTAATIVLTHHEGERELFWMINLALVAALGISLHTALALLGERIRPNSARSFLLQLSGTLLLVLYYFSLPTDVFSSARMHVVRFLLLAIGIHLLVALIAFRARSATTGFWQFNKTLFLRVLTSGLYSGVLFGGFALALAALDHLFGVSVSERWYADLWFVIVGLFNTCFVLSGVPADVEALEEMREYPKGLKFFTQFILLPIVAVYLVILYAYMGKILFTWNWPEGWVSGLVLGFSITGIFSLLLVYPIKDLVENVWIRTIARWFYVVLIPLAVMLLLAIWRRISDYGVTESRYIGIVVGLWLIGISIYFVLSSRKSIKLIPITLCVIAFLISFGPWGVFHVSLQSQMGKLRDVLARSNMLIGDKVKKVDHALPFDDARTISSIVNYLCTVHSYESLRPLFDADLDTLGVRDSTANERYRRFRDASNIVGLMGIQYVSEWQQRGTTFQSFVADRTTAVDLHGYSYMIHFQASGDRTSLKPLKTPEGTFTPRINDSTFTIVLEDGTIKDSAVCNSAVLWDSLFRITADPFGHSLPAETMAIADSGIHVRAKVYFHSISGIRGTRNALKSAYEADLYFGKK